MKSDPVVITSPRVPHAVYLALVVVVVVISSSLRLTHAQSLPTPSPYSTPASGTPSPYLRRLPPVTETSVASPSPSPSPTSSRKATGSATCTTQGALVVRVPSPNGKVLIFVYPNGCRVEGDSTVNVNDVVNAQGRCMVQLRDTTVNLTGELVVTALEGIKLGELYLICQRLTTRPLEERYSCELHLSGPTGKIIWQGIWKGNPEVVFVRCVENTAEAFEDLMKQLKERGIRLLDDHQVGFGPFSNTSGEQNWGLLFSF